VNKEEDLEMVACPPYCKRASWRMDFLVGCCWLTRTKD